MVKDSEHSRPGAGHDDTMACDEAVSTEDTVGAREAISTDATRASAEAISTGRTVIAEKAVAEFKRSIGATGDRDELPTRDPERYVRGKEIARGGMGRIVAVRDRDLGRDLAIKELLGRGAALEQRFEREMKITARLQHPAIIAVHDAGRWPSGEAFYTMKQVEGRALDQVIAANKTLKERLALLANVIAVADALAYAHSRQVIHRDLKPANVLVGRFGETVVIDWGLAKDLRRDDADDTVAGPEQAGDHGLTVVGEALGTPAYMAPEQARGERVDQSADVYSLGALLYCLLAGRMPYANDEPADVAELLELVKGGPPTALAKLESTIPPDLIAIAEKAMAREPDQRYPSAGELADDLKRFETGQLVGAHDYSTWALVKRWVGQHRAAVGVATVMALLLTVGGALSFLRITSERNRAEAQKTLAEAQKTLAEENRSEVEELLDFMLVDLRARLEPIGKLPILELVARKADQYFRSRPVDWSRPSDADKRSLTLINLGDVLAAQGNLAAALAAYRESLKISERLTASDPSNAAWQRRLATSHDEVGEVLRAQGDLAAAAAAFRASQTIRAQLTASDPSNAIWQRDLAVGHSKVGDVLQIQRDLAAALVAYRACLTISEQLTTSDPTNAGWQRDLAVSHEKVGAALQLQGDLAAALGAYRASLTISAQLTASDPTNAGWQRDLSIGHARVGDALRAQGDFLAALTAYEASQTIREQLAASDPTNATSQRDLAISHEKIGKVVAAQGDLAAALTAYWASQRNRERLAASNPANVRWRRDLALSYLSIGGALQLVGEHSSAREQLARAGMLYEGFAVNVDDFYNAACAYALSADKDKAFEMLAKAVDLGERNHAWAEKDTDLASLREDPRWQPLIDKMKATK